MKAHQVASGVRISRGDGGAARSVRDEAASIAETRSRAALREQESVPAGAGVRRHTLALVGELDQRSARILEAEIEHLCAQGIEGITLDLRELTYIDPVGVAVIAVCCDLCRKRGHDFALVPGPRFVQRAFERAGVSHLLPVQEDAIVVRRRAPLLLGQPRFANGER
jgi:anti-anti-sigma factor